MVRTLQILQQTYLDVHKRLGELEVLLPTVKLMTLKPGSSGPPLCLAHEFQNVRTLKLADVTHQS